MNNGCNSSVGVDLGLFASIDSVLKLDDSQVEPLEPHLLNELLGVLVNLSLHLLSHEHEFEGRTVELPNELVAYLSQVLEGLNSTLRLGELLCLVHKFKELALDDHRMNRLSVEVLEIVIKFGERLQVVSE